MAAMLDKRLMAPNSDFSNGLLQINVLCWAEIAVDELGPIWICQHLVCTWTKMIQEIWELEVLTTWFDCCVTLKTDIK